MATGQAAKSEKTIVVSSIPDGIVKDDVMADILMIHFQKMKNRGGDVEDVVYPTTIKGVAYIIFEDQEVAENVLKKDEHRLEDKRLGRYFPLKISLYSEHVFTCVSSVLDLSLFGDKYILEDLVQELQKNIKALSFSPLQSNGQISVQGSFPAIKSLKDNLLLKANSLSGKDKRAESKPDQRPNSRTQKRVPSMGPNNTVVHNVNREEQVIVLDTDIYYYMKQFLYKEGLAKYSVVSREVTDGDVTTIYLKNTKASSDPRELERAKERIEDLSAKLHCRLRKERFSFDGNTKSEQHKYKQACEIVKSRFPKVLVIPYDTHIDVIGSSSDTYEFTQEVNRTVKAHFQNRLRR
ncbi:RNA-binding protein 43 [Emydura macquarii macquarii]|uniref:RNA-binding protein 43 n=1 Tax=Emydura macquarii macquarii TaxID=1129001 RepID=UPI00352AC444